jgi:metallo-beta-lactamase class B
MRTCTLALAAAAAAWTATGLTADSAVPAAVSQHVEAARRAAGADHNYIFGRLCAEPMRAINAAPATGQVPGELTGKDPARKWYVEPAKVFDDLFFLGQSAFSVWGLRTSAGIILVDSIFDYSVEDEVIGGLRKLGIDPAEIRYVIISHAHGDHSGGAGILQQHGAKVVMAEADWKLYEQGNDKIKAKRDIVATDGMPITISTVLPVREGGRQHVAALWGGTLFNFGDSADDPRDARLKVYAESAVKFREVAKAAGADILLSNHTAFDGTTVKLPALANRKPGEPHPFVIGTDAVQRYFRVAEECAVAARMVPAAPRPPRAGNPGR